MSRVVYERDRDDYEEPQRRTYKTVKRYQVPDRESRSTYGGGDDDVKEEKIIIKRSEGGGRSGRSEVDYRGSDRDRGARRGDDMDVRITERVTERERDRGDTDRRDISYRISERDSDRDRYSGARSEIRVVEREREREVARAPSPPVEERIREYRFERDREYSPARQARDERPYDLERYSKSTEYYSQPQPIIIRERAQQSAPIIITEERREPQQIVIRREEPHYEIIERDEVREDRQMVRREEPAPIVKSVVSQKPQDEDYYYERRVREVARDPRRRREDDIRPSDSASQVSSDESYEYVRRERYIEDERDRSPHHRRHLAEGALAGAGAAAIIRQHRKGQGRESNHGARDVLGGAALGAVGAEVISRARSMRASSRRRSYSDDRGGRDHRRHRSRSRSKSRSKSRARQLGGLAAVAAVGALAGYALKQAGKNKETVVIDDHRRRSRSRRRRGSSSDEGRARSRSEHRDPEHRNKRIAQAGLATAAAAGIWERMRSKSRGGRERSKSRIRTAAPIVGAGLGGAALAGLYEKTKANKEAKRDAIIQDELHRGRRHRSRSRSVPPNDDGHGRRSDRRDMVAYGADPIYPDDARGRDHYGDSEAGTYRRRHGSAASSPDTRHRSRSRGRGVAEAGLAAAGAAAVAHEMGRSRERARHERERHRGDNDYEHYDDDYRHGGYITPPNDDHYPPQAEAYPGSNYFPPPPTANVPMEGAPAIVSPIQAEAYNQYPPYNPADYPPAAAGATRDAYSHNGAVYGESDGKIGESYPNDTFVGDPRYTDPAAEAAAARELQEERELEADRAARHGYSQRTDPANVSTFVTSNRAVPEVQETRAGTSADDSHSILSTPMATQLRDNTRESPSLPRSADGISSQENKHDLREGSRTPRNRSTSRVRFNLDSNNAHSEQEPRLRQGDELDRGHRMNDAHDEDDSGRRHGRRRRRGRPSSTLMNDPHERSISSASDETVEMPQRFDEHGNRRSEHNTDDLATRLSSIFAPSSGGRRNGSGGIGDMLRGIAGEVLRGVSNRDDGRHTGRSR